MTPKEKAIELYNKFLNPSGDSYLYGMLEHESAIECALIAVDEILNSFPHTFGLNKEYTTSGELVTSMVNIRPNISYWQEVKQEINNL